MILPPLVGAYVDRHLATEVKAGRVCLTQTGEMQLKPGRWLGFAAVQEISVDRVEFSWKARFTVAPLVSLHVRDWYRDQDAALEGRLWGRFPVLRARGPEVVRSEAMRYLAELPWAPQAMVGNRELEWREIDDASVDVATRVADSRVGVRLHLDEAGDIVKATAEARPRRVGKHAIGTPFIGSFGAYEEVGGVRVPTTAEAVWQLPDGPYTYFRARLTNLEIE
jgi:hypothetical protein